MSRDQKVNEPETMSTASAYLYKEQAECAKQVHQYLVEHLDSRVTQAELARRYHISLTSLKGAFKQVYGLPINTYLRRRRVRHAEQPLFHNGFEHFGDRTAGWVRQPQPFCGNV